MSKKCAFVEASISPAELCDPIDWSRCILRQRITRDKLVCPGRSIGQNKDAGYESLADILVNVHFRCLNYFTSNFTNFTNCLHYFTTVRVRVRVVVCQL